jgi:hypothetical protein
MILVVHVTSYDRITHELNGSDSGRRTLRLLALAEGNCTGNTTPQRSTWLNATSFKEAIPRESDSRPLLGTGPEVATGLVDFSVMHTGYG